jgi:low affinity Fe/Cu permease
LQELFRTFTQRISEGTGKPWAFICALGIILLWGFVGPLFGFSDTWQLVINTGTTIVTFLMGFLIQHTQNHDARAAHLKLDELIRGVDGARTRLVDLENMTDDEIDQLQDQFQRLRVRVAPAKGVASAHFSHGADG